MAVSPLRKSASAPALLERSSGTQSPQSTFKKTCKDPGVMHRPVLSEPCMGAGAAAGGGAGSGVPGLPLTEVEGLARLAVDGAVGSYDEGYKAVFVKHGETVLWGCHQEISEAEPKSHAELPCCSLPSDLDDTQRKQSCRVFQRKKPDDTCGSRSHFLAFKDGILSVLVTKSDAYGEVQKWVTPDVFIAAHSPFLASLRGFSERHGPVVKVEVTGLYPEHQARFEEAILVACNTSY